MVTAADWIRVELTPAETSQATELARLRQQRATEHRRVARGYGSLETHTLGCMGELAVAKYEACDYQPGSFQAEKRRGYDVAGWQVRTRALARYGLNLHAGDHGRFLLALGHAQPVIFLAGWITAEDAFPLGERHEDGTGDRVWWLIDKRHLQALPAKNGYGRAERQLIPMDTPFFCEQCHSHHPIAEHAACRAGSSRQMLLLERSQRIRATLDFTPHQ